MKVHLKIIGRADGVPSTFDEQYVVSCDVDGLDGRGMLLTSGDKEDAMAFDDVKTALEYWQRQSTVVPRRTDGRPNRPLTAYTVEMAWTD